MILYTAGVCLVMVGDRYVQWRKEERNEGGLSVCLSVEGLGERGCLIWGSGKGGRGVWSSLYFSHSSSSFSTTRFLFLLHTSSSSYSFLLAFFSLPFTCLHSHPSNKETNIACMYFVMGSVTFTENAKKFYGPKKRVYNLTPSRQFIPYDYTNTVSFPFLYIHFFHCNITIIVFCFLFPATTLFYTLTFSPIILLYILYLFPFLLASLLQLQYMFPSIASRLSRERFSPYPLYFQPTRSLLVNLSKTLRSFFHCTTISHFTR